MQFDRVQFEYPDAEHSGIWIRNIDALWTALQEATAAGTDPREALQELLAAAVTEGMNEVA